MLETTADAILAFRGRGERRVELFDWLGAGMRTMIKKQAAVHWPQPA